MGLVINWRIYGSSGFREKPEGLVIENYKNRAKNEFAINAHIKTICNPRSALNVTNPHIVNYNSPYYAVSENGNKANDKWFNYENTCNKVRINHYYTKSFDEFVAKRNRGRAATPGKYEMAAFDVGNRNEIYDYIMEPYVNKLKQQLQFESSSIVTDKNKNDKKCIAKKE